jgi:hypothetical protein
MELHADVGEESKRFLQNFWVSCTCMHLELHASLGSRYGLMHRSVARNDLENAICKISAPQAYNLAFKSPWSGSLLNSGTRVIYLIKDALS